MRLHIVFPAAALLLTGCATLTEDAMTPIALSFSDGASGSCNLYNKRGAWTASIPSVVSVRKSDDPLRYDCSSIDGRKAFGAIPSEMGGKIIASAVFIDFGITDAITDKHRRYASSYVIPLAAAASQQPASQPTDTKSLSEPMESGQITKPAATPSTTTKLELDPAKRCDACKALTTP
jgi:hypothetical protein